MSETRTRSRGLIDPSDVLDWQTGARDVLTVDGDFIPRSRVNFPKVAPYQRVSAENTGQIAISGVDPGKSGFGPDGVAETGGPHPEAVDFSAPESVGHVSLIQSLGAFPLTPPDARDFL